MIVFSNGPAAGVTLLLRLAPLFLRVTRGLGWDALDQLGDFPDAEEAVVAYRRVGEAGHVHIDFTRRRSAWYATGCYEVVQEQPPDRVLRSKHLWRAWCWAQVS